MSLELFRLLLITFAVSGLLAAWFINITNNHYKRGYRDGYTRGKAVASERFSE